MNPKSAFQNPTIKLIVTTVFATAVLVIAVQYLYESHIRDLMQNDIHAKSKQVEILSAATSLRISDAIKIIEITSKEDVVRNIDYVSAVDENLHGVPQDYELGKRQLASNILGSYKNFAVIRFTLANGDMYMMEPYESQLNLKTTNFAFRDWFKNGMYANAPYVSEVYVGQSIDRRTVSITAPVYSPKWQNIIGLWGGVLDLNFLVDMINGYNLGKNVRVILVDHNGNEIIDTQNPNFSQINSFSYLDSVKKGLSESDGTSVETINGKKMFVAYQPVRAGTHVWAVLLLQPYEDAFSDVDRQRLESFIVTGFAIVGVSLFSFVVLPLARQPIKRPHKKAKDKKESIWSEAKRKLASNIEVDAEPFDKNALLHLLESDHSVRRSAVKRYSVLLIISSIAFSAVVVAYSSHTVPVLDTLVEPKQTHPQTRYVIENLRGDVVNTWIAWNIQKSRTLAVNMIVGASVPQEKIDMVKDVILSNETLLIDDSLLGKGPGGTSSKYYKGWVGAVAKVSKSPTKLYIPSKFELISSSKGEGDIIITLTNLKDPDGYAGYTKSVADGNQILKSTITIYGVSDLSKKLLSAVARHEFGHALGLAHSTATEDLMHDVIQTEYPYISDCDIDAIVALYNGEKRSEVVCEK